LDWYGSVDCNDYAVINRASKAFRGWAKRAGLKFAICYEDDSIGRAIDACQLQDDPITVGAKSVAELQKEWFTDPNYLKLAGRPLLLVFTAQHGRVSGGDWVTIFTKAQASPVYLTNSKFQPPAQGAFAWPPIGGGKALSLDNAVNYLNTFDQTAHTWRSSVTMACPGFRDIYSKSGFGTSWGSLESRDGQTFDRLMEKAREGISPVIQVVTWNDYGEGTDIEPTLDFGYLYLEKLQSFRRQDYPAFAYTPSDLRQPQRLYLARKKYKNPTPAVKALLDKASAYLLAGQPAVGKRILDYLETGK
jgi:hypothetical protein